VVYISNLTQKEKREDKRGKDELSWISLFVLFWLSVFVFVSFLRDASVREELKTELIK
jgi:hypothetical protein